MAGLVPIGVAMAHVREDGADRIEIVQGKLDDAEAIVIDYLKKPDHGWTSQTLPGTVRSAILLVLGTMYENREGGLDEADPISPAVVSLLRRQRDPAIA